MLFNESWSSWPIYIPLPLFAPFVQILSDFVSLNWHHYTMTREA